MAHPRSKLVAVAGSLAVATASLFAFAQPAAADQVVCESYFSNVHCDLSTTTGGGSNERWTVNGTAWSSYDNMASMSAGCWPGSLVHVGVSYLNNGANYSLSTSVMCRSGAPM